MPLKMRLAMSKVRCADCGFVAFRDPKTNDLVEIVRESRELGHSQGFNLGLPVCSVGACSRIMAGEESVLEALRTERACDAFYPWVPTFNPKEHREMQIAQELRQEIAAREKENKAWQAEQKSIEKAWQAQQKADDRAWQEEQKRKDRQWQFVMGLAILVIGYLIGVKK